MRKIVLLTAATVLLVLGLATIAQAVKSLPQPGSEIATPQQIYDDYAENRHLTKSYTEGSLLDYLASPWAGEYGSRGVYTPLNNLVRRLLRDKNHVVGFTSTGGGLGTFPFTRFEVLAALVGGLLVLGSGFAIRRATR